MFSVKNSPLILTIAILTFHSLLPQALTTTNSLDTILYDVYPFIRVYKNGTIQRFIGQDFVPASIDPKNGVRSKDLIISKTRNISARIYVPKDANPGRKIPLLVYFHGGGFFTESAFSPTYHHYLNSLVAEANVVALSVNYRLAPEHPLPVAYQDSWLSLKWVFSGDSDEVVRLKSYVNFGRVYLGGDSAGGNIAHQMAIRVGSGETDLGVKLNGIFLNCPYFWGKRAVGNESGDVNVKAFIESIWLHAYPNSTSGLDDPLVNPAMDSGLGKLGCERVLVYVAGNDVLRFRGFFYMEVLKKSGWGGVVNVFEVKGKDHDFNLNNPSDPKAIDMMKNLGYFLNG